MKCSSSECTANTQLSETESTSTSGSGRRSGVQNRSKPEEDDYSPCMSNAPADSWNTKCLRPVVVLRQAGTSRDAPCSSAGVCLQGSVAMEKGEQTTSDTVTFPAHHHPERRAACANEAAPVPQPQRRLWQKCSWFLAKDPLGNTKTL